MVWADSERTLARTYFVNSRAISASRSVESLALMFVTCVTRFAAVVSRRFDCAPSVVFAYSRYLMAWSTFSRKMFAFSRVSTVYSLSSVR